MKEQREQQRKWSQIKTVLNLLKIKRGCDFAVLIINCQPTQTQISICKLYLIRNESTM